MECDKCPKRRPIIPAGEDFIAEEQCAECQKALARITELEGQIARAKLAADWYIKRVLSGTPVACIATEKAEEALQKALSSAPTVLFSLRLMEGHGGGISVGHYRHTSDENEWPWVAIDLPLNDFRDLGGAVVIVLERQPKSEQEAPND